MSEMHLKQPRLTYSACGSKERIQKFKETGDSRFYRNELDIFNIIWLMEILKI